MLGWLARVRFATADQVAARFGLARKRCWARLRVLIDHGLVERKGLLRHQPGVHFATRQGLRRIGMDVPVASVSLQNFEHDLAVADLQVRLEMDGMVVLSEREMRAQERAGERPFAVDVPVQYRAGAAQHRPDLVIDGHTELHAVELERVAKAQARLDSILLSYMASPRYAKVVYVVPELRDHDRVIAAVERIGGQRRVVVVLHEPIEVAA